MLHSGHQLWRILCCVTLVTGCSDTFDSDTFDIEIDEIPQTAIDAQFSLLGKSWQFTLDSFPTGAVRPVVGMPPRGESAEPRRQAACNAVGSIDPVHLEDGRLLEGDMGNVILRLPDKTYRSYSGGAGTSNLWTSAASDPTVNRNFQSGQDQRMPFIFWSLTAALTPGGHHVRLYLETEGRIKTMISEKDNFVRFHNEGSPVFYDVSNSRLPDLTLRDPNVAVNDAGVYVMTWDNRNPSSGPGSPSDATYVSKTFGLAFSVDGLNWTVYSNEMKIQGLPRERGESTLGGGVRHVVPVFTKGDEIRLYFSVGVSSLGPYGQTSSCSLGTAISTSLSKVDLRARYRDVNRCTSTIESNASDQAKVVVASWDSLVLVPTPISKEEGKPVSLAVDCFSSSPDVMKIRRDALVALPQKTGATDIYCESGGIRSDTMRVEVVDSPPVYPVSGQAPLTVTVCGWKEQSEACPDPRSRYNGDVKVSYTRVRYGDGSEEYCGYTGQIPGPPACNEKTFAHTYDRPGSYSIEVVDTVGCVNGDSGNTSTPGTVSVLAP